MDTALILPVQYNPSGQYSGDFKFLGFKGHWGDKKHHCGIFNNIHARALWRVLG